jgi:hypothetical protein
MTDVLSLHLQMETTPFGQRLDIIEFCVDNGIIVMCDNPLAKDLNSENRPEFLEICEGVDMTPQQVSVCLSLSLLILAPPFKHILMFLYHYYTSSVLRYSLHYYYYHHYYHHHYNVLYLYTVTLHNIIAGHGQVGDHQGVFRHAPSLHRHSGGRLELVH